MFLLDTNVISDARRGAPMVTAWFRSIQPDAIWFSVIALGEIQAGIEKLRSKDRQRAETLLAWLNRLRSEHSDRILPITMDIALEWGRISALRTRGAPDALIAATAIVHGLTLVTRNSRDFEDLPLTLVNPWQR
ncbi:MAG: type II toxin-antitoxin system VapC family toxin [Bosea sp. (in: a-proteobacteria)]